MWPMSEKKGLRTNHHQAATARCWFIFMVVDSHEPYVVLRHTQDD